MLRRLANISLGASDLSQAVGEQKVLCDANEKVLSTDIRVSDWLLKWSKEEKNIALQDVFEKNYQLSHIRCDAHREYIAKMRGSRNLFKDIVKQEKGLDEARKHHASCFSRLSKLKKQVDAAAKKNDPAKLESLIPELHMALTQNDQATVQLEEHVERNEYFKGVCARQGLEMQADALLSLANCLVRVAEAQQRLAELIPTDPPNISATNTYEGGPSKSQGIVADVCQALRIQTPTTSSYVVVDNEDDPIGPYSTTPVVRHSPEYSDPSSSVESQSGRARQMSFPGPPVPPRKPVGEYLDLSSLNHHEEPEYDDPRPLRKQKPPVPPRPHAIAGRKSASNYTLPRPAPEGKDSPSPPPGMREQDEKMDDDNFDPAGYGNPVDAYEWLWKRQRGKALQSADDDIYQDPEDCLVTQTQMEEMLRIRGNIAPYASTLAITLKKADAALTHGEMLQRATTPEPRRRYKVGNGLTASPPSCRAIPTTTLERKRRSRSLDDMLGETVCPLRRERLSAVSFRSSPGSSPRTSPRMRRKSYLHLHSIDLPSSKHMPHTWSESHL